MRKARNWLVFMAVMAVLVFAGVLSAETIVRPDTTSSVMIAAGDSLFGLPAAAARTFDLNDLPDVETTVATSDTILLGDCYKAEFFTFGTGDAGGVYFITSVASGVRSVSAMVFIGSADSVRVNAWQY